MSESDRDETERRRRARFVDALTAHTRQPGEHSRLGTRVAGATAVLALAAGATLGLGAWRSYQSDEHDKKQQLAARQAAAYSDITASASAASPTPTPKATTARPKPEKKPVPHTTSPRPHATHTTAPKKKKAADPDSQKPKDLTAHNRKVVLWNAFSGQCADIPYYGPGKLGLAIEQFTCDTTDADNQKWNMTVQVRGGGPGGSDLVQFANTKDGLCIDLPERGPQPGGTELSEANCTGTEADNQLWWFASAGDGTVWIRNYASNHQCLRVEGSDKKAAAARLDIGTCAAKDDTRWLVVTVK
ncbi:RICIN domain-containing protein [Actinacidiphila alni]|uniref:RICIN domain-containing protein n=1 Tax=Actinacidiphila alni TaxID=380248 RepID=UPI003451BF78